MFYFDAHCHMISEQLLNEAAERGIAYLICNATKTDNWEEVYALSEQIDGIYPCIGVHPWFIDEIRSDWLIKMQLMLEKYPDLMIGEIGLDGTRPNLPRQAYIFENCLKMAQKYTRPVHIHGYKAWQNIINILACYPSVTCLFHRFAGSECEARKLSAVCNAYFSVMTHKPTTFLPADRILVESDSPDGLHHPSKIIELVERLGLDKEQLATNFQNFIGNRKPTRGVPPRDFERINLMQAENDNDKL